MDKIKIILTLFLAVTALSACKAERVVVEVEEGAIQDAISGGVGEAEFSATFETSRSLDERVQSKIDAVERAVRAHLDITDFLVTGDRGGTQIEIEGYLPITTNADENAPWHLLVEPFGQDGHVVRLAIGSDFNSFAREIEVVDMGFRPDRFHPTTIRLRASDAHVTVPAGYVDGEARIMWSTVLDGRTNIRFGGGIFNDVGGAFIIRVSN